MHTVCAWCQRVLVDELMQHGLVSHGICMECADKVRRELEISKLEAMWRQPACGGGR